MTVYLASPGNQTQAHAATGMPVLFSFVTWRPFMEDYQATFPNVLIDSGAYSEMNSGKKVDVHEFWDWAQRWEGRADAIAGLDDISGNWRRSLENYKIGGFPTFHDTDPPELLDDLIGLARERGNWIGLGLKPPRSGKREWLRRTLERIPDDLHVHGWALRLYSDLSRLNSLDSTNWFRDAMKICRDLHWLTYSEAVEIIVKRYQRIPRKLPRINDSDQMSLIEESVTA